MNQRGGRGQGIKQPIATVYLRKYLHNECAMINEPLLIRRANCLQAYFGFIKRCDTLHRKNNNISQYHYFTMEQHAW